MKKSSINVGDRVLRCLPWRPGMTSGPKKGEGVVTLITEAQDESRLVRVLWVTGTLEWHPESELVNVKNVKKSGTRGSD